MRDDPLESLKDLARRQNRAAEQQRQARKRVLDHVFEMLREESRQGEVARKLIEGR